MDTTDDVNWDDAAKTSSTRGKKKKSEWADDDFDSADVDMKTAKDDAKLKRPPAKKGKKGKATEWGDDEDTDAGAFVFACRRSSGFVFGSIFGAVLVLLHSMSRVPILTICRDRVISQAGAT